MKKILILLILFITSCCDVNFLADGSRNYTISLGRGSGKYGLDLIEISPEGYVAMWKLIRKSNNLRLIDKSGEKIASYISKGYEISSDDSGNLSVRVKSYWVKSTFQLSNTTVQNLNALVDELKLLGLENSYTGNVLGGTQWILRLRKDTIDKSIYLNNKFPGAVKDFAQRLDHILEKSGYKNLEWTTVAFEEARMHEKEIWYSINRRQ